jgi:nucleotide-binding universal stress UspA family protein
MTAFRSVLCAVDTSDIAARVLRHAVGFARVCGARLTVLTVTDGDRRQSEAHLESLLSTVLPGRAPNSEDPRLRVARITQGGVADAILEFAREDTDLLVTGTHTRSGLSRWLLGSTSAAILEQTRCPTLLIPPAAADVVSLSEDGATLNFGAVMAAVDLAEHNERQLRIASELAALTTLPLVLMTVAEPDVTESQAEEALTERARMVGLAGAERLVVRRGAVVEEISRAAVAAPAGLVVMGLRPRGHGVAGAIATRVVHHGKDTVVLAVPAE